MVVISPVVAIVIMVATLVPGVVAVAAIIVMPRLMHWPRSVKLVSALNNLIKLTSV